MIKPVEINLKPMSEDFNSIHKKRLFCPDTIKTLFQIILRFQKYIDYNNWWVKYLKPDLFKPLIEQFPCCEIIQQQVTFFQTTFPPQIKISFNFIRVNLRMSENVDIHVVCILTLTFI